MSTTTLSTLAAVMLLHWVVLVTPGANVIVVSHLAADGHRKAACFAALGITVVALIWSALAILGVNAVFAAHPRLRLMLQSAGGIYLCYVAFGLWRAGPRTDQPARGRLSRTAAFRLGFITNITNPKSALFFGSVFATALPAEPPPALLAAAVFIVFANALVWHLFLAFAFSQPRVQAAYARQRIVFSRVAGALVGVFGLRLLVASAGEMGSGIPGKSDGR